MSFLSKILLRRKCLFLEKKYVYKLPIKSTLGDLYKAKSSITKQWNSLSIQSAWVDTAADAYFYHLPNDEQIAVDIDCMYVMCPSTF